MDTYVGRVVILVRDYEQAKAFYASNFGFQTLFEHSASDGRHFLHMGVEEPAAMGIWFIKAESPEQEALVGRQTGEQPLMVLYTKSLEALAGRLKENGTKIIVAPVYSPEYSYLHCLDLYGNELVIVELKSA